MDTEPRHRRLRGTDTVQSWGLVPGRERRSSWQRRPLDFAQTVVARMLLSCQPLSMFFLFYLLSLLLAFQNLKMQRSWLVGEVFCTSSHAW